MQYSIITTIQKPTDAVLALACRKEEKLVVIGDKKTPQTSDGHYDCIERNDDWVNIYQFFAAKNTPNKR